MEMLYRNCDSSAHWRKVMDASVAWKVFMDVHVDVDLDLDLDVHEDANVCGVFSYVRSCSLERISNAQEKPDPYEKAFLLAQARHELMGSMMDLESLRNSFSLLETTDASDRVESMARETGLDIHAEVSAYLVIDGMTETRTDGLFKVDDQVPHLRLVAAMSQYLSDSFPAVAFKTGTKRA